MNNRPTFTKAELERATAVAIAQGCEVVIEKTAGASVIRIKKVDGRGPEGPVSGPKSWD